MVRLRFSFIFLCLALFGVAPAQSWRLFSTFQNVGGDADETGRQMVMGSDGSLYTLSSSGTGLVLAKRDSSGSTVWRAFYAAEPSGLAVGADGSLAVVGRVDRGNVPAVREIVTLRYSASGSLLWAQGFEGVTTLPDPALSVTLDASGNAYVGGTVNQDLFSDLALIKYTAAGVKAWSKVLGPSPDQEICTSVKTDASGNVFLVGNRNPSGSGVPVVYKFDSSGNQLWTLVPSAPGVGNGSALDANGAIYLAVAGAAPSVVKIGGNGAQSWRTLLTATATPLGIAVSGTSAIVSGALATNGNGFVAKVGSGGVAWTAVHAGPGGQQESFNSVATASDGTIYAAGNRAVASDSVATVTMKVTAAGAVSWALLHAAYVYTTPLVPPTTPTPLPLVATNILVDGSLRPVTFTTINGPGSSTGYDIAVYVDSTAGAPSPAGPTDQGGTNDAVVASVTDAAGNTYAIGETQQGGGADVVLQAFGPTGTKSWIKGFGGPGPDLAYAVTAAPGGGVIASYGVYGGASQLWATNVRRYDAAGTLLWSTGALEGSSHIASMAVGSDGATYMVGQDQSVFPFRFRVTKIDNAGSVVWSKLFAGVGPADDYPFKVALDGSNNLYVVGNLWNGARYLATLQKYSGATGDNVWTRTYSLNGTGATAFAIVVDSKNARVYMSGTEWGNGGRGFIRKYDLDGNFKWLKMSSETDTIGERFISMAMDSAGRLVVAGAAVRPDRNVDMLAAKYESSTGALVWKRLYDGPGLKNDIARHLAIDPLGAIYVGGTVSGGATGRDYALWKLNEDGSPAWPASGDGFTNSAFLFDSGQGLADSLNGLGVDAAGAAYITGTALGSGGTYDLHAMKFGPTYDSQFVTQQVPGAMVAGQTYFVSVEFANASNVPWTAGSGVALSSANPADKLTWSLNRVALAANEAIQPGQQKKFAFRVVAPTAGGTYNFQWQMRNGAGPFGPASTNVPVNVAVAPDAAYYVLQSVPATVRAGQSFSVTVKMRNVGTNTWTRAAGYVLAPSGGSSNFGVSSVALTTANAIATGQDKFFTFNCLAPSTKGTYTMRWQMKHGTTLFGDQTTVKSIVVN